MSAPTNITVPRKARAVCISDRVHLYPSRFGARTALGLRRRYEKREGSLTVGRYVNGDKEGLVTTNQSPRANVALDNERRAGPRVAIDPLDS